MDDRGWTKAEVCGPAMEASLLRCSDDTLQDACADVFDYIERPTIRLDAIRASVTSVRSRLKRRS